MEDSVRRRNPERTRQSILSAAQEIFSRRPYAEASLKEITAKAGANPALVSRYFGSKEKLFEAALEASLDAGPLMPASRESFGEQVVSAFLSPDRGRVNPLSMLIFSTAEAGLQSMALRLLHPGTNQLRSNAELIMLSQSILDTIATEIFQLWLSATRYQA